jgi:translocation and assembly module TamB
MTFSSTPEMTQEEILNLLSSQGALGSAVIGGEDIGIQTIIFQELIRLVNSSLQKDVISDLETNFRSALSLDRIEIDTYNYGVDREFAIYLGKNLSDKFYLEYASYFNEDGREGEISFEYKLNQISVLKGSYLGDNDYQISIESEIEF